jgi:hypothetical protein
VLALVMDMLLGIDKLDNNHNNSTILGAECQQTHQQKIRQPKTRN